MLVEVERVEPGRLRRSLWAFRGSMGYGNDTDLRIELCRWEDQERSTTRHKWQRAGEGWQNRPHNGVVHFGGYRRPAAEVPFPADVAEEAKRKVMERTVVKGPCDPEGRG